MAKKKTDFREIDYTPDKKIVESNDFIKAHFDRDLGITGEKLLRIIIAQCDSINDSDFFEYHTTAQELAEQIEVDTKNLYRVFKRDAARLMSSFLVYENDRSHQFEMKAIFDDITYDAGVIRVVLSRNMKPFFLKLRGDFTQFQLGNILTMKYIYSPRIYELINMHLRNAKVYADKHKQIIVTIEEIRKACGIEDKYPKTKDLKNKVITPALVDIERCARMHIELSDVKEGRSIVAFTMDCWSSGGWEYLKINDLMEDTRKKLNP